MPPGHVSGLAPGYHPALSLRTDPGAKKLTHSFTQVYDQRVMLHKKGSPLTAIATVTLKLILYKRIPEAPNTTLGSDILAETYPSQRGRETQSFLSRGLSPRKVSQTKRSWGAQGAGRRRRCRIAGSGQSCGGGARLQGGARQEAFPAGSGHIWIASLLTTVQRCPWATVDSRKTGGT